METTLNKIKQHHPCKEGWKRLLKSLNKTEVDNDALSLITILKSNGIKDAIWCLRCFDYLDYCLFLAGIAESVLPIYEKNNNSLKPCKCIQAIRDFKAGKIGKVELKDAAYIAAADAADVAYNTTYIAADADAARKSKWDEIEQLFIKHFGAK